MQRSCQNSSLSPSVPLDIWFQSFKKKSNHNNTLAPFCYLIAPGSWFNKFKYYSSWFFGIETFFNLILRSLLGETETISKYSDIIFTPVFKIRASEILPTSSFMTEQCFYSPKQNDLSLYQTVCSFWLRCNMKFYYLILLLKYSRDLIDI